MNRKHWILMGGIAGCIPSHYDAYHTKADALESARALYNDVRMPSGEYNRFLNRYVGVYTNLRDYGYCGDVGGNTPKYDVSYVSLESCDCSAPWEHSEGDTEYDWID